MLIRLLFLLTLSGCLPTSERGTKIVNRPLDITALENIILIDTFPKKATRDTSYKKERSQFWINYIGNYKDTLSTSYFRPNLYDQINKFLTIEDPFKKDSFQIWVDTQKHITAYEPPLAGFEKTKKGIIMARYERSNYFFAYPIYIYNPSKDTVYIGHGERAPLNLQAKDSLGFWKNILVYGPIPCPTGETKNYLYPNQLILSSCKLFEGDYYTDLRITFNYSGKYHSNSFKGYINYTQFESEPFLFDQ